MVRRGLSWSLLAPAAALVAPAPAFAVDYLTPEQVESEMFAGAKTFELRQVELTAEQQRAVEQRLGEPLRRTSYGLRLARARGSCSG